MPKIWAIQHVSCETPGTIADVLGARDISVEIVRAFEGERIPADMREASGLVVMGGPMGVGDQDRYPFLREEMKLITAALGEDKPVLGICLGCQMVATVLGAELSKGTEPEIGWLPVDLTQAATSDPLLAGVASRFVAYHWHGDTFELPSGAVSLASSALTGCQAFRYGSNAYGFLFHMEVTDRIIAGMVETFSDELLDAGLDGGEIQSQALEHLPGLQRVGARVFGRWADLVDNRRAGAG